MRGCLVMLVTALLAGRGSAGPACELPRLEPISGGGGFAATYHGGLDSGIDLDADVLAVGSAGQDQANPADASCNSGAVDVFVRGASGWLPRARLTAPVPTCRDGFGRSVAASGDWIAIGAQAGAPGDAIPQAVNPGRVYVFERRRQDTPNPGDDTWVLCPVCVLSSPRATSPDCFANPDNSSEDRFGYSIDLDGDALVVGAFNTGCRQGEAYVFRRVGAEWLHEATLTPDPGTQGRFGEAVAIDGDSVLVGAPLHAGERGGIYVFAKPPVGLWRRVQGIAGGPNDRLGDALAIDGDRFIAGSPGDEDECGVLQGGAARVFRRAGSAWSEEDVLVAPDCSDGDAFGSAVDIDGETALVGSRAHDERGDASGAAYAYRWGGSSWTIDHELAPVCSHDSDHFGGDVALSGNLAAGLANTETDPTRRPATGSVYVFDIAPAGACPALDNDADGIAEDTDRCCDDARNAISACDTDRDGYANVCDPDFDQSSLVDANDFSMYFVPAFRSGSPTASGTDLDCDGVVDASDFSMYFVPAFKGGGMPGPSGLRCAGSAPCDPPTPGETCVATADFTWSSTSGGAWSGCSPDPGDRFRAVGFDIEIANDLEIRGDLVADDGGRISVAPGATLRAGGALRAERGGTLELKGRDALSGRIADLAWSARSVQIDLGRTAQGHVARGDLVHVLDEYPDAGEPLSGPFQTTPGPPQAGRTRPSYARGWMFRVTNVSGRKITVSLDDWAGIGTPYVGRRGIGGIGLGLMEAATLPAFHGLVTRLRIDPASLQIAEGDLAEQYVEIAAGPCAGKLAKIVGASDMGATAGDVLYVAGPWLAPDGATSCGTGSAWIDVHYGLRVGDPIAVYRVARVDGLGTGYVEIRDGHLVADRFDLQNLGFFDNTAVTPPLRRAGNIVFRHADDCTPPGASVMRRGNVANLRVPSPERDVGAVYAVSHTQEYGTWRSCGTFDLSDTVVFDQLAIHDTWSSDPAGSSGTHGFYSDGVGVRASRLLVARTTDDGIGGHLDGFQSQPQPFEIDDARVFSILPDVDKSAQCFEPGATNVFLAQNGMNEQQRVRGLIRASDLMAIGCSRHPVQVVAYGAELDRAVVSGGNYLEVTNPALLFSMAPSTNAYGVTGVPLDDPLNRNLARDALLFLIGRAHGAKPFALTGDCDGCIVVGDVGRFNGTRLYSATHFVRSFLDFTNSNVLFEETWVAAWRRSSLSFVDSVLLSDTAMQLGTAHPNLEELTIARSSFGMTSGGHAILGGVATSGASVAIDGVVGTTAGPAGASTLGVTASAALADPCLETTVSSPATAYNGATATGAAIHEPGVGPDAADFASIPAYRAQPGGLCAAAAPQRLGIARENFGRAHADLGDLFLDHRSRAVTP